MKIKLILIMAMLVLSSNNTSVFGATEIVIESGGDTYWHHSFSDDRTMVESKGADEACSFINKSGELIFSDNDGDDNNNFSEGFFIDESIEDKKIRIYDKMGNVVVTGDMYDEYGNIIRVNSFHNGLALVTRTYEQEPIGYIDKTGKLVIDLNEKYDFANNFYEGYAIVGNFTGNYIPEPFIEMEVKFIDTQGEEMPMSSDAISYFVTNLESRFNEGRLLVYNDEQKYGFMNYSGEIVIPCVYTQPPQDFSEGMAVISNDEMGTKHSQYGYINLEGEQVIAPVYDIADDFSSGLALVQVFNDTDTSYDNEALYIDKEGNKVFDESFYNRYRQNSDYDAQGIGLKSFSEGLARVQSIETKRYGYVNTKGEEVIPCEFVDAGDFKEGLAWVEKDGEIGFIKSPYVTSLRINGKHVMTDTDPINMEGKTMVPIEETAKYFGVDTTVDLASNGVYFKKGDIYAENFIGDKKLNTNSKKAELTTPIVVKDGVAYIYIKDLADIFGYTTSWEADTSTVVLEG